MSNSFYLQILSVNRSFFSGRCNALIFQEEDGEREIQAYHENMIIAVHEGEIRFRPENSEEWMYGVVGVGFVQIANNRVTLLVETAENPEEIDVRRAEEAKERALEQLRQKQSIQEYYRSSASLSRAMSRLKVAKRFHS